MFDAVPDFDLGEDIAALRAVLRGRAQERLKPMAAAIDRENDCPNALWPRIGALGPAGAMVEHDHGDAGRVTRADAAACVRHASEQAMVQAVQALGGAAFLADSTASRLLRDVRLMEIGAGTSEIRRMLIGRELIGAVG